MKVLVGIVIILIVAIAAVVYSTQFKNNSSSSSPSAGSSDTSSPSPTTANGDPADAVSAHKVVLKTSMGDIALNLYPEDAPKTVKNFVTLGKRGYYNNIIFHRVIKDFVIQAGDPTGTGSGGQSIYGASFADEINSHKIVKGTLAMANTGQPSSNGSQFYIVTQQAQPSLDGRYTVFGQVADDASQNVVQAIAAVPVTNERPNQDVKITGFDIVQP